MDTIENHCLKQAMIEGYLSTRNDRAALNRDWQIVDGENWPSWDGNEPAGDDGGLLDAEDRPAWRERQ